MAVLVRAMAMAGQGAAVEALVNGAAPRAPGLGARALVRLAWASARVRWQSPALDIVLEEASGRADRLQPQAMSNLLWSMASLRNRNKNALRTLLPHMVDRVRRLSPQGLATGLWALAACVRAVEILSPDLDGLKRMQFCACRLKPFGASRHLVL